MGLIFLVAALKDSRGKRVDKFVVGMQEWQSQRATFAARTFVASDFSNTMSAVTQEVVKVDDDSKIAYQPLFWRVSGRPNSFPSAGQTFTSPPSDVAIDFTESATVISGGGVVSPNYKRTISGTTTSSGSSTSRPPSPPSPPTPPKDQWYKMNLLCRQVADGSGSGYFAGDGGIGCYSSVDTDSYGRVGAYYTACGSSVVQNSPSPSDCSSYSVDAQIRSQKDPVVAGFRNGACFSNGAPSRCSFGVKASTKAAIGLILLISGIAWTCCVYGGLYALVVYLQKRDK